MLAPQTKTAKSAWHTIFLLVVLYSLQGLPLGLASQSVPLLLQAAMKQSDSSVIAYSEIGKFTWALWPYSLKLLWSPIVDSLRVPGVGLRKSWVIPTQLLAGFLFLLLSFQFVPFPLTTGIPH